MIVPLEVFHARWLARHASVAEVGAFEDDRQMDQPGSGGFEPS